MVKHCVCKDAASHVCCKCLNYCCVWLQVLLIQAGTGQDQHGAGATVSLSFCISTEQHVLHATQAAPAFKGAPVCVGPACNKPQPLTHACVALTADGSCAGLPRREPVQLAASPAQTGTYVDVRTPGTGIDCSMSSTSNSKPRDVEWQFLIVLQVPNGYHGLKLSVRIGVPDPVRHVPCDLQIC